MLSPKARKGLVPAVLAVAACAALPAAASARPQARGNDLGVQVVRFAKGTSPAAMKQAVADAGAEVVTDLSAIDALAVVPTGSGFKAKIKGQKGVKAAWLDLVNKTSAFQPDPLHDFDAFNGENAPGVLQWEDDRDGVRSAWDTTRGSGIKVAVIDSGIDPSHPELRDNVLFVDNTIPCNRLTAIFGGGVGPLHDCSKSDTDGHGTWVASRMVGDDNGIGTNGIAPDAKVMGYKALATGYGGADELDRRRDAARLRQRRGRHQHVARRLRRRQRPGLREGLRRGLLPLEGRRRLLPRQGHGDRRLRRQRARPQPAQDRHADRLQRHAHDRGRRRRLLREGRGRQRLPR